MTSVEPSGDGVALDEDEVGPEVPPGVGRRARWRSLRALGVVVLIVVVAGLAYGLGAARSGSTEGGVGVAPPPRSLTDAVVTTVLDPALRAPATVSVGAVNPIDCTPSSTASAARQVFTRGPLPVGTAVVEGAVLAEVSGRPVIALGGAAAAYREILPDQRGGDVAQLQEALHRLGHTDAEPDGHFGPATWEALRSLYATLGYEPIGPTAEEQAALDSAEQAVDQAAARADAATTQAEYDQAVVDRQMGREHYEQLRRVTGPRVPFCEIVFLSQLPAVVGSPEGSEGEESAASEGTGPASTAIEGPWMVLSHGSPTAEVIVSAADAGRVEPGMAAVFTGSSVSVGGTVREVRAELPASILIDLPDAGPELSGTTGEVAIALPGTGDPVLAVSVAAPVTAANGQVTVIRLAADGRRERIVVELGETDGTVVAVEGSQPPLHEGDDVLVGVQGP